MIATAVTRPVFEGIGPVGRAIFYALAAASTALFVWGVWLRVNKYRTGRAARRWPIVKAALSSRLRTIGSGAAVAKRNLATGVAHFFIFWSFAAAFLATVILTIDTDVVRKVSLLVAGHRGQLLSRHFLHRVHLRG